MHVVGLAVMVLALGAKARSQVPGQPSPTMLGDARAHSTSSPWSTAGMPAARFAKPVDSGDLAGSTPGPTIFPQPWYSPVTGEAPTAACVESGIVDTIAESVFGRPDSNAWRPLPLSTFLGEGWNEAWVPSPRGSGGAPRQGWINAVAGNMYRAGFFTFAYGANAPPKGNAYLGSYTILTPLSRRLLLITNIPFALRNNAENGLPTINTSGLTGTTSKSLTGFGDISFTPRVLLHETKDFSLTAELTVLTPTGSQPLAGKLSLTPSVGFWNNFAGGWVFRGGIGDLIPTGGGGTVLISQFAVGQTLTRHDVPLFGDLTYYLSAVANTPLSEGDQTSVTLTPGIRTHLGREWSLLAGLPTPLTRARVADLGMILWFMKAW